MGKDWHGINDLYYTKTPPKPPTQKPQQPQEEQKKKDDSTEVRLSEGKFVAGSKGFQFNEKCKVRVKVDYLKKTTRKKITFKLFVVYNKEVEDLKCQVDGFEDKGFAEAEVRLFYGDKYHKDLQKNPGAKCSYKFKASHPKGEKEIESELLEMPSKASPELKLLSTDTHFAPKIENIEIKYSIKNCNNVIVKLLVRSEHYPKKTIFERELTPEEKQNGEGKVLTWDGKTSCTEGDLKDGYINPLFSPYIVKLGIPGGKESGEKTFDVLYAEIKIERSTWIGDGTVPDENAGNDWYRYQLNALGYFGGPFTTDIAETPLQRNYLEKAMRLYKYYNVEFVKKAIEDRPNEESFKDLLDATTAQYNNKLNGQIKLSSNSRMQKYFQQTGNVFNGGEAKFVIPSWYYEKGAQFQTGNESRSIFDESRLNEPFIPIKAAILIKKKDNSAVDVPEAVGKAKVAWRVVDPPEADLATRYAVAGKADDVNRRPYIENIKKWLQDTETYSDGTKFTKNCPEKCGGKKDLEKLFLSLKPFKISKPDKIPCSEASIDSTKKELFGKTGVNFVPSKIGGDSYQIIADIDFTGLANSDHLNKKHNAENGTGRNVCRKETGIFTVWRDAQITRIVKWAYKETEPDNTYDFASRITNAVLERNSLNYRQCYIDFPAPSLTNIVDITDVITNDDYLEIINSFSPNNLKATLTGAGILSTDADAIISDASQGKEWLFFDKFALVKEHLYGRAVPPQKKVRGNKYKVALYNLFYESTNGFVNKLMDSFAKKISRKIRKALPVGHIIVYFKPHAPVDIKTNPAAKNNTISDAQYIARFCSAGLADGVVLYDLGDSDKCDYVLSHELGHHNFLYHHRTNPNNENVDTPLHHDLDDNNCIMSYTSGAGTNAPRNKGAAYDPFYCAKCNLRLRGWKVEKLGKMQNTSTANGTVKPDTIVCAENSTVNIEATPAANFKFKKWKTVSGTVNFADENKAKTIATVVSNPAKIEAEFEHV